MMILMGNTNDNKDDKNSKSLELFRGTTNTSQVRQFLRTSVTSPACDSHFFATMLAEELKGHMHKWGSKMTFLLEDPQASTSVLPCVPPP
jgi:hypothetical protein